MDAERAYDFSGSSLPIFLGFVGQVTDELLVKRQRVVPFGPGLALAQPLVARYLVRDEHVADVELGVAHGRPAAIAVRGAHGEPLTGTLLRSIPLGRIVTEAAQANTFRILRTRRGRYVGVYYSSVFDGMLGFENDLEELRADVADHRRLDDDFLDRVASLYREAVANGEAPAPAIARVLGPVHVGTARRWVMAARKAGKLGKALTRGGRAGEAA
jgi:hypothetical protein